MDKTVDIFHRDDKLTNKDNIIYVQMYKCRFNFKRIYLFCMFTKEFIFSPLIVSIS